MEIDSKAMGGGISLIRVSGDIDMYSAPALRDYFLKARQSDCYKFVIDCSEVLYIDSCGIGVLMHVFISSEKRNIAIRFAGITRRVGRVLELTKMESILPLSPAIEDALKELNEKARCSVSEVPQLIVDGKSELFDMAGMSYGEYYIGYDQVRRLAALIANRAPSEIREANLLEQQISEIVKNAVKHGNRMDPGKKLRVWYGFGTSYARLIVEDEGEGFKELERWNEFYRQKQLYFRNHEYDKLMEHLSFRTNGSVPEDGGNALFAAVEYWNSGVVYTEKRNCVGVKRLFH